MDDGIEKHKRKQNLFLDIDQTLIAAVPLVKDDDDDDDEIVFDLYNTEHQEKATLFDFENMDDYYIIFQRPGLQKFLDYIFKKYNVSIWTAASKDYALFIIDKIILAGKKERKLDYVFFSYHCGLSSKIKKNTKKLEMLWDIYKDKKYNKSNTFIFDDYDEVFKCQKNNCIIAKPFFFSKKNAHKDDFLDKLIEKMEKCGDGSLNTSKINNEKWF